MKKLTLLASALISSVTFASSSSTAKMYPIPYLHNSSTYTTESSHTFTITNDTSITQKINACYTITTCPEWQYYVKSTTECETFNLNPSETRTGNHSVHFPIKYPITGWCKAIAKTELKGGTYSIASNEIKFEIGA